MSYDFAWSFFWNFVGTTLGVKWRKKFVLIFWYNQTNIWLFLILSLQSCCRDAKKGCSEVCGGLWLSSRRTRCHYPSGSVTSLLLMQLSYRLGRPDFDQPWLTTPNWFLVDLSRSPEGPRRYNPFPPPPPRTAVAMCIPWLFKKRGGSCHTVCIRRLKYWTHLKPQWQRNPQ